ACRATFQQNREHSVHHHERDHEGELRQTSRGRVDANTCRTQNDLDKHYVRTEIDLIGNSGKEKRDRVAQESAPLLQIWGTKSIGVFVYEVADTDRCAREYSFCREKRYEEPEMREGEDRDH